jgi:hypothetical protein
MPGIFKSVFVTIFVFSVLQSKAAEPQSDTPVDRLLKKLGPVYLENKKAYEKLTTEYNGLIAEIQNAKQVTSSRDSQSLRDKQERARNLDQQRLQLQNNMASVPVTLEELKEILDQVRPSLYVSSKITSTPEIDSNKKMTLTTLEIDLRKDGKPYFRAIPQLIPINEADKFLELPTLGVSGNRLRATILDDERTPVIAIDCISCGKKGIFSLAINSENPKLSQIVVDAFEKKDGSWIKDLWTRDWKNYTFKEGSTGDLSQTPRRSPLAKQMMDEEYQRLRSQAPPVAQSTQTKKPQISGLPQNSSSGVFNPSQIVGGSASAK